MPVNSMTGFGAGSAEGGGVLVCVEINAVNRKQFDFVMSAPAELAQFERRCQALVMGVLSRGRVQCQIKVSGVAGDLAEYDVEALRLKAAQMGRLAEELGVVNDFTLSKLLGLPGASCPPAARLPQDEMWGLVEAAFGQALGSLAQMRAVEGAALEADIRGRIGGLRAMRDEIATLAADAPGAYRDALMRRIAELDAPLAPDDPSLAREVALFADRCDVSEELTRLAAHFDHFEELCGAAEPCGRKLDFLCQEINREINTIGSKTASAAVSRIVIDMKSALEAVREQVQNVE